MPAIHTMIRLPVDPILVDSKFAGSRQFTNLLKWAVVPKVWEALTYLKTLKYQCPPKMQFMCKAHQHVFKFFQQHLMSFKII